MTNPDPGPPAENTPELDLAWLRRWIQPQHLEAEARAAYREELRSHPTRRLVLKSFLRDSRVAPIHRLFSEEAHFESSLGLYSAYGYVSREVWLQAEEKDRFFKYGRLAGILPGFELSRNLAGFLKLRAALVDSRFRDYLAEVTGLRLSAGTMPHGHSYSSTDFLKCHDDDDRDRLLTLVLYLSKGWRPEYGGALHLLDRAGREEKVEAEYNSLVLFDVTAKTQHYIAPVTAPGKLRQSIGCWYHKPSA